MILSLVFASLCLLVTALDAQPRTSFTLDTWQFAKGAHPGAADQDFDDRDWQRVRVPHDWAIAGPFIPDGDGNTGKLPWKGQGWYRTTTQIPAVHADQRVYLLFDGVMSFPKVYVNGNLAGKWDYGYNSFYLDITSHIAAGRNLIAVHADTRQHDSRWYPGAGIYRKVQMVVTHPVHIPIWGVHVTTPDVKPHYADVRIATAIRNSSASSHSVEIRHTITNADGEVVGRSEATHQVGPNSTARVEATVTVSDPRRWDIDDPHLYRIVTELLVGGQIKDRTETRCGVRTMRFTADHGFFINDRRIQFKGVNLHHDLGPLGAAFNKRAMRRQLEIMKSMGCNAIRNSHNTAAPELLELCDEMGLLFFNEIFDKYDGKADITDTTDFEAFADRNMRNFVMRDRNHPSVFLWSVGNEIGDVQWNVNGGFHKLHTMVNALRKYDHTRPVTLVCDNLESAVLRHFDYYDVHAWNYGRRYRLARQLEPNKSVIISESASTLSTRGFYELPLPEDKTDFTSSLQ
ncbi:MAG: glycoside hydrolase family 2 TIM barrel-domain containing protein, partial [Saprospiraceae bacterium]|nr:glycoside hydrolase family 2 TIM barrel-domain containing protein [Saprospiraceae bacterium]